MAEKPVILTGDRPTGKLHIGHYVGSLKNRVEMQNTGKYTPFIMIADQQALTDNARDPEKIRKSLIEVALDYLAVGLDPAKSTIFVQSQIPALSELNLYYLNLVTVSRLERNPTVKAEIQQRTLNGRSQLDSLHIRSAKQPILRHLKLALCQSAMTRNQCLNKRGKLSGVSTQFTAMFWLNPKAFSHQRVQDEFQD